MTQACDFIRTVLRVKEIMLLDAAQNCLGHHEIRKHHSHSGISLISYTLFYVFLLMRYRWSADNSSFAF